MTDKPPPDDPDATLDLPTSRRRPDDPDGLATTDSDLMRTTAPGVTAVPGLEAGLDFGPYHLIQHLGEGGFGQVWEAESRETGRRVALKVLTAVRDSSPDAVERFRREGRLSASLRHPNCVFVFGAEEIDGLPVITMEIMRGATLQDRLDAEGPLESRRAVDVVLDLLDGLEAAHAAGILHRDIKPSNCFLDAEGNPKLGDFGLSRTLEADSRLTVTGTFLGTPYYASPEQVKGRDLDFRSDLYSLGAVLYTLLTGEPPFEGSGAGQVLARILSEDPTAFEVHGKEVPRGLQRVVLRLMAKDPDRRYASHAALRAALLPYSGKGLPPASQGRRTGAILADSALLVVVGGFTEVLTFGHDPWSTIGFLSAAARLLIVFLYFFLPESWWGRSLGKFLFGPRVTGITTLRASAGRVALRTAVFVGMLNLPNLILVRAVPTEMLGYWVGWTSIGLWWAGIAALLSTMRRGNGYAGLHELASGTRVRGSREEARTRGVVSERPSTSPLPEGEPGGFGPYQPSALLWGTESEALLVVRDDLLDRDVWLHRHADADRLPPVSDLGVLRPGRLRWLQGSRETPNGWDAFEPPSGTSLEALVAGRGRLGWAETRGILRDLAAELEAGLDAGDLPERISLLHVWVDADGRALLLPFPCGGDPAGEPGIAPAEWGAFLQQVLLFSLEGRRCAVEDLDGERPAMPLPEHARSVVDRLCGQGERFARPAEVEAELARTALWPTRVTRAQRLRPVAVATAALSLLPALMLLFWLLVAVAPPGIADVFLSGIYATQLKKCEDDVGREAFRKLLAAAYHEAALTPKGDRLLMHLTEEQRAMMEAAAEDYPVRPDKDELLEARVIAGRRMSTMVAGIPKIFLALLWFVSLPAVLLSFLFRGSVLFSIFGIAVQTRRGERAGRLRCLVRAVVAWSPLLVLWLAMALRLAGIAPLPHPLLRYGLGVLALAGLIYAIARPERGIQDRIAATHLVPK